MNQSNATIMVVDDEPFNLEIITEYLEGSDYQLVTAQDGSEAWNLMAQTPQNFDAILLDRMMPHMNGLEVAVRMKEHPVLKDIPIIIQTGLGTKENILEGIHAGVFYYLTKPYQRSMLRAILRTALEDLNRYRNLQQEVTRSTQSLSQMSLGHFQFCSLEQGRDLAATLAKACPVPNRVVVGLSELLVNAVEHGNLGISYEEKSRLKRDGIMQAEVQHRLLLPENAGKCVDVWYERSVAEIRITVKDQGAGFDWRSYLNMNPDRAFDTHGRGIFKARTYSFDHIEYCGKGNQVTAIINTAPEVNS